MATAIQANTLTALKTSLGSSAHGWTVLSVDQFVETVALDSGGTMTNITREIATVTLRALGLRAAVGVRGPLDLVYRVTKHGSSIAQQRVTANGATYTVSDSALDTTVMALAATFLSTSDTALKATIDAGAVTTGAVSADLLAALIASIGDADHGWTVYSYIDNPAPVGRQVIVTLGTLAVKVPPTEGLLPVPTQLNYIADLTPAGSLIVARLMFSGAEWSTTSSTLHTAVMAKAATYLTAQDAAVTEALETGPT